MSGGVVAAAPAADPNADHPQHSLPNPVFAQAVTPALESVQDLLPLLSPTTMPSDTQVALSRIARSQSGALSKMTRQIATPFLQKLYEYVATCTSYLLTYLTQPLTRLSIEWLVIPQPTI